MNNIAQKEKIDLPLLHQGKVRDVYDLDQQLLIVASDRISAFDHVLPTIIPDKGKILHALSMFWFDMFQGAVPNHLITGDFEQFPTKLKKYEYLRGRSMIVKKAKRIDIECIVRGYLAGSGWKEYRQSGTVCGIKIHPGLLESSKLPGSIFTPSSKEEGGKHDENISFEETVKRIGIDLAQQIKELSLLIYNKASQYAESRGIIIADTKFEFGLFDGKLILIDEVLTPDSSRFWPADTYQPGKAQDSYDKQYVRDYLEEIRWNKQPPAPALPQEVALRTSEKYLGAYRQLTGRELEI